MRNVLAKFLVGVLLSGAAPIQVQAGAMSSAVIARSALDKASLKKRIQERFGPGGLANTKLDALAKADQLSGIVAIAIDDRVLYSGTYGFADRASGKPVNADTRFDLASTGKLFTAVAVGQLVQQGKLDFSDPVGRYLKGLPSALAAVTVEQLLTHRAGLHSYFDSPDWPWLEANGMTVSDYMRAVVSDVPSGTGTFQYSNSGYILLGALVEAISGEDYYDYVGRHIFGPAKMTATGFETAPRPTDAFRYTKGCFAQPPSACTPAKDWKVEVRAKRGTPAGGAYSTAGDMIRFASALRHEKLLNSSIFKRMSARMFDVPDDGPADGQGLGFAQVRTGGGTIELFGHNGATVGAASQLDMLQNPSLTIIVLTNSDGALRRVIPVVRNALFDYEN